MDFQLYQALGTLGLPIAVSCSGATRVFLAASTALVVASIGAAIAQRRDAFSESRAYPAIDYNTARVNTAITELNRKLDEGSATFTFDPTNPRVETDTEEISRLGLLAEIGVVPPAVEIQRRLM